MLGQAASPGVAPPKSYLPAALIAAAIICAYFLAVAIFTSVHPYGDDIAIAASVAQIREAAASGASLPDIWPLLWSQHNEHRLVLTRLAFWASAALFGEPNYKLLAITGNIFLLAILAVFVRAAVRANAPASAIVVLTTLTFNFGSADSAIWAMAALSNYGAIAFTLASLFCLTRGGPFVWVALAAAGLAVLSQSNGLLAPFLGAAYLMANCRWAHSAIWLAAAYLLSLAYFAGFSLPDNSNAAHSIIQLPAIAIYVLSFCGSAIGYGQDGRDLVNLVSIPLSAALGALLIGLNILRVARAPEQLSRPYIWICAFIVLTGAMAALARIESGLWQALSPRYHVNSFVLIASTLLMWITPSGYPSPIEDFLRRRMTLLAVLGVVLALASTAVLWYVVNVTHPAVAEDLGLPI